MFTFFGSVQKNNNNTSTNTNNKNNNLTMSVKTFDKKLYFLLNLWILQHLNDPCETCETFFLLLIRQSCSGLSSLHHWDGSERLSRKLPGGPGGPLGPCTPTPGDPLSPFSPGCPGNTQQK